MPYMLKKNKPEFDVVDGPFAGKKYRHSGTYEEVPPGEKDRFEVVKGQKAEDRRQKTEDKGTKKKGGFEAKKSAPAVNAKGGKR